MCKFYINLILLAYIIYLSALYHSSATLLSGIEACFHLKVKKEIKKNIVR